MHWLVYGSKGFIGTRICQELYKQNHQVITSDTRVDNTVQILQELADIKPDRVICCTGRTYGGGCNTIDYLETPGPEINNINVKDNLYAPISLGLCCSKLNMHLTYIGTGCIFEYEKEDPTLEFDEEDNPNFFGSSYSVVKGYTDRLFHMYPLADHVLNLRIRMPIIAEDDTRNFITKIASYEKVINIPNSMTVLPDLIPHMISMAERKITGTINCVNPGAISHNEVLGLYRTIVNPEFTWKNFSTEEQDKMLKSRRSNNTLKTDKLTSLCPKVKDIHTAVKECLQNFNKAGKEDLGCQR